ncbi:MAG TPA: hypothetical protein VFB50_00670 [Chloroflexota bacterium]|nr:hypothetical protein [Chloroflexota bacterium]
MDLIRFTAIRAMRSDQVSVWINPARVIFIEPRYSADAVVGTRIHFGGYGSDVLDLVEEPDEVLALLAGHDYDRENKLDLTYEAARADLLP